MPSTGKASIFVNLTLYNCQSKDFKEYAMFNWWLLKDNALCARISTIFFSLMDDCQYFLYNAWAFNERPDYHLIDSIFLIMVLICQIIL